MPPLVAAQPASAPTPRGVHGSCGQAGPGRLPCRGPEPHCMRTRRPEPSRVARSRLSDPPSSPLLVAASWGFCRLCVGGACFLLGASVPGAGTAEGARLPLPMFSLGSEWGGGQAEGLWAVLAAPFLLLPFLVRSPNSSPSLPARGCWGCSWSALQGPWAVREGHLLRVWAGNEVAPGPGLPVEAAREACSLGVCI